MTGLARAVVGNRKLRVTIYVAFVVMVTVAFKL